ncbi:MAG: serine O-acetyltransferase [Agrobacterium sp.]|nr:serine O-acetyltransferase [Agrobacterium sp.]
MVATNRGSVSRNKLKAIVDPIWGSLLKEVPKRCRPGPSATLAAFLYSTVHQPPASRSAVIYRICELLDHPDMQAVLLRQTFQDMLDDWPEWGSVLRVDIQAVYDRDPACTRFMEPLLYFKGFQAIQTHRLAHWLYKSGRRDLALYLQSRSSSIFQTDINPAARIGKGIFLDHATGLVVGETAVIGDNVSILHGVTLGGTGKEGADRHPKIANGVMIGAGAKILGNIEIGSCSRIAAGSVVLKPVPPKTTVAGVPARVVGEAGCSEPSRLMDQVIGADI